MTSGREHRVPLSTAAVELLRALPTGAPDELVLHGLRGPLSDMSLTAVLHRMKVDATAHMLHAGVVYSRSISMSSGGERRSICPRISRAVDSPHRSPAYELCVPGAIILIGTDDQRQPRRGQCGATRIRYRTFGQDDDLVALAVVAHHPAWRCQGLGRRLT